MRTLAVLAVLMGGFFVSACQTTREVVVLNDYAPGEVAGTHVACKNVDAMMAVAAADEVGAKDVGAVLEILVRHGHCIASQQVRPVPMGALIHEYIDYQGNPSQVRKVYEREWWTLVYPKGFTPGATQSSYQIEDSI